MLYYIICYIYIYVYNIIYYYICYCIYICLFILYYILRYILYIHNGLLIIFRAPRRFRDMPTSAHVGSCRLQHTSADVGSAKTDVGADVVVITHSTALRELTSADVGSDVNIHIGCRWSSTSADIGSDVDSAHGLPM